MLIYDGDCGFCTLSAEWAERRLPPGTPVVPWQTIADLGAHGLTHQDVTTAAYWVDEHGGTHRGERGVGKALMAMRYRLPGGSATCRLPRS